MPLLLSLRQCEYPQTPTKHSLFCRMSSLSPHHQSDPTSKHPQLEARSASPPTSKLPRTKKTPQLQNRSPWPRRRVPKEASAQHPALAKPPTFSLLALITPAPFLALLSRTTRLPPSQPHLQNPTLPAQSHHSNQPPHSNLPPQQPPRPSLPPPTA